MTGLSYAMVDARPTPYSWPRGCWSSDSEAGSGLWHVVGLDPEATDDIELLRSALSHFEDCGDTETADLEDLREDLRRAIEREDRYNGGLGINPVFDWAYRLPIVADAEEMALRVFGSTLTVAIIDGDPYLGLRGEVDSAAVCKAFVRAGYYPPAEIACLGKRKGIERDLVAACRESLQVQADRANRALETFDLAWREEQ